MLATELDLAYIAGFFDGEGHVELRLIDISFEKGLINYQIHCTIKNTNSEALHEIRRQLGLGFVEPKKQSEEEIKKGHKLKYDLRFPSTHVGKFYCLIQPYLRIKKNQVNCVLEYLALEDKKGTRAKELSDIVCAATATGPVNEVKLKFITPASKDHRPETLAYIAGFFDGEGCSSLTFNDGNLERSGAFNYNCRLSIKNTDHAALVLISKQLGLGTICVGSKRQSAERKWSYLLYFNIKNGHSEKFLRLIRPYLRVKAQQADLALEYFALKDQSGVSADGLSKAVCALNKRGC